MRFHGRGSCPSRPIVVTNANCSILVCATVTVREPEIDTDIQVKELPTSYGFTDFVFIGRDTQTKPVCDLFDRYVTQPELPIDAGAYPEWNRQRPYLTGQHVWIVPSGSSKIKAISQEALLNDILYVLMGLGGEYICPVFRRRKDHHQELQFELKAHVDGTSHALLQRMIPLGEAVYVVQRFVEMRSKMEYGTVCHALTAAMRCMLDDWMLLITQLESQLLKGKLTLQTLWFYIQPAMSVMMILAEVSRQAASQELQATELLNLLHAKMKQMSGDQNAQALLQKLLEAAAVPYFGILEKWICEGKIDDPYSEFMIKEDPTIETTTTTSDLQSAYWRQRYRMRQTYMSIKNEIYSVNCVPAFLKQHADLILTTGKYLNAIRECGRQIDRPLASDEHPCFDTSCSYLRSIQKAHRIASQAFLDMFIKDLKLIDWLGTLKHLFLMDKADMVGQLMDIAEEELEKIASHVILNRLQSLVELAFKTSSLPAEINTEPLHVHFDHRSFLSLCTSVSRPSQLARASIRSSRQSVAFSSVRDLSDREACSGERLAGWDIFMMHYRIEWPLILIVPPRMMQTYQLLFKQLFVLKRSERELGKAWKVLLSTRTMIDKSLDKVSRVAQMVCYTMQHTTQQYLRHLTVHTIEPHWLAMETALAKAKDVDKVIEIHQNFLNKVMWQSLLKKPKGIKELDDLVSESLRYAKFITNMLRIDDWTSALLNASGGRGTKTGEVQRERRRLLGAKIEEVLNTDEFKTRVLKARVDYAQKLRLFVGTLIDYCDLEGEERSHQENVTSEEAQAKVQSREDLDKLLSLIEILKPCTII